MENMAVRLYQIRWILMFVFFLALGIFGVSLHIGISDGVKKLSIGDQWVLFTYWSIGLIFLYMYSFAAIYAGKFKGRSRIFKALMMLWPNIFVLASIKAACQLMSRT